MVFVLASTLGLKGTEGPQEIDGDPELLKKLESIRGAAAVTMGLAENPDQALAKNPAFPMIALVAPPLDYRTYSGHRLVKADEISFLSRLMFMQVLHKTYAGTGAVCTGVAALIKGTIVSEVFKPNSQRALSISIGHPAGIMTVEASVEEAQVKRAAFARTARRLMEGYAFVSL
jgi:2-methylaconitate cis-trans-isomerase PrpF